MHLTYFCNLSCTTTQAGFTEMSGGSIASFGSSRSSDCLIILMYVHNLILRNPFSQKRTVIITQFLAVQSSWCNLIAKRSFLLQHGNRAAHQQPVTYNGMLTMLATSAYRAVMILTSVIVSFALGSIPFAGSWISFAFMCWVNSSVYPVPVDYRQV